MLNYKEIAKYLNETSFQNEEEIKQYYVEKINLKLEENQMPRLRMETKIKIGAFYKFMDSTHENIILEFKNLNEFSTENKILKHEKQIIDYMEASNLRRGWLLNNQLIIEFIKLGDTWTQNRLDINEYNLETFFNSILKVMKNSSNNFSSFKEKNGPLNRRKILEIMYFQLVNTSKDNILFEEWKINFMLANPVEDKMTKNFLNSLKQKEIYEIFNFLEKDEIELEAALFTLTTLFSITTKFITFSYLDSKMKKENKLFTKEIVPNNVSDLLYKIEEGEIFRDKGIFNLFSFDHFSWYLPLLKDNNDFKVLIHDIYKETTNLKIDFIKSYVNDFFINIYQAFIPHSIRKALGEFFTPDYMCDEIVNQISDSDLINNKRIIDPTCGSGAFLMSIINRKKALIKDIRVSEIVNTIVGTDINPVSILAARANYLINILDIWNFDENIFLPLYITDAMETIGNINENLIIGSKTLQRFNEKVEIKIALPKMAILNRVEGTNFIKYAIECIENDSEIELLNFTKKKYNLNDNEYNLFNKFINSISFLKKNKILPHILDIILQLFYFNTELRFDILIGNLPWVKWSNLPNEYRNKLKNRLEIVEIFSDTKNSGGNSLDIYAPILASIITNKMNSKMLIKVLLPKSLVYNPSMAGLRIFINKNNLYFSEITFYDKNLKVFEGVETDFAAYTIETKNNKNSKILVHSVKKDKDKNIIKIQKFATFAKSRFIAVNSVDELLYLEKFIGEFSYNFRSGLDFSPKKIRQFNIISESEKDGIKYAKIKSAKVRKEQKVDIPIQTTTVEKDSLVKIINSSFVRGKDEEVYSWFAYSKELGKEEIKFEDFVSFYPLLGKYLISVKKYLEDTSKFNARISKYTWYGNNRNSNYMWGEYKIMISDNGIPTPFLLTSLNEIPEGHIRYISSNDYFGKKNIEKNFSLEEALYIYGALSTNAFKQLLVSSSIELNRSFVKKNILFRLPRFDKTDPNHLKISNIAKKLLNNKNEKFVTEIENILLKIFN